MFGTDFGMIELSCFNGKRSRIQIKVSSYSFNQLCCRKNSKKSKNKTLIGSNTSLTPNSVEKHLSQSSERLNTIIWTVLMEWVKWVRSQVYPNPPIIVQKLRENKSLLTKKNFFKLKGKFKQLNPSRFVRLPPLTNPSQQHQHNPNLSYLNSDF